MQVSNLPFKIDKILMKISALYEAILLLLFSMDFFKFKQAKKRKEKRSQTHPQFVFLESLNPIDSKQINLFKNAL